MKKLMIAAAIVCAAVAGQAATATWTVMNIQDPAGGSTTETGWLVQVFDAATVYSYEDALAGKITAVDSQLSVPTSSTATTAKAGGEGIGSYAIGEGPTWYAVIYDAGTIAEADHYIVSKSMTKTVAGTGANITLNFGNMAATTTANQFLGQEWQSVPEPTSGLLLLLGVAGLALRRRRA